jgi:hypothetical protein
MPKNQKKGKAKNKAKRTPSHPVPHTTPLSLSYKLQKLPGQRRGLRGQQNIKPHET